MMVGEALPPLEFDVTLTSLVMYAGATWDFHRYHYDPEFVAKLAMPAPYMAGQIVGALVARQLMQWGGADAFVRKLNIGSVARSMWATASIVRHGIG